MREIDLSGLLVDFKHREIDDITELETVFIDEIQALRHLGADLSGISGYRIPLVTDEIENVLRLEIRSLSDFLFLLVCHKLVDRSLIGHICVDADIAQSFHADAQSVFFHLLKPALGLLRGAWNPDSPYNFSLESREVYF